MSTISSLISPPRVSTYILCGITAIGMAMATSKLAQKIHQMVFGTSTDRSKIVSLLIGFLGGLLFAFTLCIRLTSRDIADLSKLDYSPTANFDYALMEQIHELFAKVLIRYCCVIVGASLGVVLSIDTSS